MSFTVRLIENAPSSMRCSFRYGSGCRTTNDFSHPIKRKARSVVQSPTCRFRKVAIFFQPHRAGQPNEVAQERADNASQSDRPVPCHSCTFLVYFSVCPDGTV